MRAGGEQGCDLSRAWWRMARDELFLRPLRGFFRGRTVLITGASSGIGYDVATVLAGLGVRCALLARRQALLDELAARIAGAGGNALVLAADVTSPGEVRDAVALALHEFGHLDILVNSAGILETGLVETMDADA